MGAFGAWGEVFAAAVEYGITDPSMAERMRVVGQHQLARSLGVTGKIDFGGQHAAADHILGTVKDLKERFNVPAPASIRFKKEWTPSQATVDSSTGHLTFGPTLSKMADQLASGQYDHDLARRLLAGHQAAHEPTHTIAHELGHIAHIKTRATGEQGRQGLRAWFAARPKIASEVSRYAADHNEDEFVAEVFSGIAHGRKYSPETLKIYEDLGGPPIHKGKLTQDKIDYTLPFGGGLAEGFAATEEYEDPAFAIPVEHHDHVQKFLDAGGGPYEHLHANAPPGSTRDHIADAINVFVDGGHAKVGGRHLTPTVHFSRSKLGTGTGLTQTWDDIKHHAAFRGQHYRDVIGLLGAFDKDKQYSIHTGENHVKLRSTGGGVYQEAYLRPGSLEFGDMHTVRGKGIGSNLTRGDLRQIYRSAKQLGLNHITTIAGGYGPAHGSEKGDIGYKLWPQIGFDAPFNYKNYSPEPPYVVRPGVDRTQAVKTLQSTMQTLNRDPADVSGAMEEVSAGRPLFPNDIAWPQLFSHDDFKKHFEQMPEEPVPDEVKAARTLQELHATPAGRAWWKRNGYEVGATLDFTPGSPSMKRFGRILGLDRRGVEYEVDDDLWEIRSLLPSF